jgi:antitoxin (DNA-binding transcriptional repressor) of toxin-antitoxin stability system
LLFESDAESILITKHGKPVAKLVPVDADADDIYNFLAGKESITGVVVSSALSDDRRVSI